MMHRQHVRRRDEDEVLEQYPRADLVEGWYFREREISPGAYVVEGTDLWGRLVAASGNDPALLLAECTRRATAIRPSSRNRRCLSGSQLRRGSRSVGGRAS